MVATKLDRLGRNAMDVRATVGRLAPMGVNVHGLALGGVDLASAAGKMTIVSSALSPNSRGISFWRGANPAFNVPGRKANTWADRLS